MPGCGKYIVYWWCCGYVEFTVYLNGSIHCVNSSTHKYVMQKSKLCTASHYIAITFCITTLGLMSRFDMSRALSVRPVTTNMHRGTILRDCESMFGSISYTMCTEYCHTKRESYVCFFLELKLLPVVASSNVLLTEAMILLFYTPLKTHWQFR